MKLVDAVLGRYRESTDPLRTERRVELVLVVLLCLLLLQLALVTMGAAFRGMPEAKPPSAELLKVLGTAQRATLAADARDVIRGRPVFWQGRRPLDRYAAVAEQQQEKQAQARSSIEGVKLLGVFGDGASAGVIAMDKDKKRRVMQGGDIRGWQLVSVQGNEARFQSGAEIATLTLQLSKGGGEAKAAPASQKQPAAAVPRAAGARQSAASGADSKPQRRAPERGPLIPKIDFSQSSRTR